VDIKNIATGIGLVITIAGLFVYQGQLIQRIDVLESKTAPDIKPLEQRIAVNEAEIKVLDAVVKEMKARSDNPLSQ
tara:strand:+ start:5906 stop:6133 length:228 start_codon:yes stop_codon:yes gene_type:complete